MSLFREATNDTAYAKIGIFGQSGSGKTYTSSLFAIGLHHYLAEKGLAEGSNPVCMMDTEAGRSWVKPMYDEEEVPLLVSNTRAFSQLVPAIREAEKEHSILHIDSLTHFWRELIDSYLARQKRSSLHIGDWSWLKGPQANGAFTDAFVNSAAHIIWCARASFDYDFFTDEAGKKQMERSGVKPSAETNTAYEPSLVILMSRHQRFDPEHPEKTETVYYGTVLKDRSHQLTGKVFENPTFSDILPHIERLNLGGEHVGIDMGIDSRPMCPPDNFERANRKQEKEIALDEIRELMLKHYPGRSTDAIKSKGDLMEAHFKTRSWARIEQLKLEPIIVGRDSLWLALENKPYGFEPPKSEEEQEMERDRNETF